MVIKNLIAATQTKREGNFLKLFSSRNFNQSTSARLPITQILANICRTIMAKLNHIRRYRFDSETNIALQKLGKKQAHEVRQCIREMLEKKGLLKPIKLPF